jgi:hypothetical protein
VVSSIIPQICVLFNENKSISVKHRRTNVENTNLLNLSQENLPGLETTGRNLQEKKYDNRVPQKNEECDSCFGN